MPQTNLFISDHFSPIDKGIKASSFSVTQTFNSSNNSHEQKVNCNSQLAFIQGDKYGFCLLLLFFIYLFLVGLVGILKYSSQLSA